MTMHLDAGLLMRRMLYFVSKEAVKARCSFFDELLVLFRAPCHCDVAQRPNSGLKHALMKELVFAPK